MRFISLMLVLLTVIVPAFCVEYSKKNAHKHIEMVVFDLGGVVIQADRQKINSFLMSSLNINAHATQNALNELKQAREKGIAESTFWSDWAQKNSINLPENWQQKFDEAKVTCIKPDRQVLDIIAELKERGYRVALFSNIQAHEAQVVEKLGIFNAFDPVVLSYKIGKEKPDPQAFSLFESKALVSPDACLFIDDTQKNITAADIFGMDTILYTSVDQLRDEFVQRRMLNKN